MASLKTRSDVIRLWCFAPSALLDSMSDIMAKYRWAYFAAHERPAWARDLPGRSWTVCESMGEYNGCLGLPDQRAITKQRFSNRRLKDPKRGKTRALDNALQQRELKRLPACPHDEQTIRSFLTMLCRHGAVVLVLDDGGLVEPTKGGTKGQPEPDHIPYFNTVSRVFLDDPRPLIDRVLPIPYWTPLRVDVHDR